MLGVFEVYHGENAFFLNPRDCDIWTAALDAKLQGKPSGLSKEIFDQLLGHCQV